MVGGHFDGRSELWGLAAHPKDSRFVTASEDMTVRVWDSKTNTQVAIANLEGKARAVAYSPSGDQIAVATVDGRVQVLDDKLDEVMFDVAVAKTWIQALQYSPDNKYLAVGAHDGVIYILETSSFSCLAKCKGHTGAILGVDFSVDSTKLMSCARDYDLLYWDIKGNQIKAASTMRDTKWATCTCVLGWSVQGIWGDANGNEINCVHRSPNSRYLVSGDDHHRVKLFKYPSCKEHSQFKECKGHAEHVTNVKFNFDGTVVYSIGGIDKAIMQFEVKETPAAPAANDR